MFLFYLFFFFQAEDGIRDLTVTGVQTCALPILAAEMQRARRTMRVEPSPVLSLCLQDETELAQRGGVILPGAGGEGDGRGDSGAGLIVTIEEEKRFGAGRGTPIGRLGLLGLGLDQPKHAPCYGGCLRLLAG